jgi:hypothetical protein
MALLPNFRPHPQTNYGGRLVEGTAMAALLAAQPNAVYNAADDDDEKKKKDEEAKVAAAKKAEEDEKKKKDDEKDAKKAEEDDKKKKDDEAKAEKYKEGEPNDQKEGRAAVSADRERVRAILAIGERVGKPKKAMQIAFDTNWTEKEASIALEDQDEPQSNDLRTRMATLELPIIGPSAPGGAQPMSTADFIVAAGKKRRGEI